MVKILRQDRPPEYREGQMFDLSFMYSKQCDLSCSFCMYSSGPQVYDRMDLQKFRSWMKTVRWGLINGIGIYGGEPSLFLKENSIILEHTNSVPRFCITNGTWSKSPVSTAAFMLWALGWKVQVFVSGTDQHVAFQDRAMLEYLSHTYPTMVRLKAPDTQILPMGRLIGEQVKCTVKCMRPRYIAPTRIAVQPDGTIIYQSCDGVYPVIGSWDTDTFDDIVKKVDEYTQQGFRAVCPYYEERCRIKSLSQVTT
jgi:hypothetical protein